LEAYFYAEHVKSTPYYHEKIDDDRASKSGDDTSIRDRATLAAGWGSRPSYRRALPDPVFFPNTGGEHEQDRRRASRPPAPGSTLIVVAAAATKAPVVLALFFNFNCCRRQVLEVPPRGLYSASSGELLVVEPTPPVGRLNKQDG